jgi:hypothetical protein
MRREATKKNTLLLLRVMSASDIKNIFRYQLLWQFDALFCLLVLFGLPQIKS